MMQRILIIAIFISGSLQKVHTQAHDNVWMFGNTLETTRQDRKGFSILRFSKDTLEVDSMIANNDFKFNITNTSVCNRNGDLLWYTNGVFIMNNKHEVIENGHRIKTPITGNFGDILPQGVLVLPFTQKDSQYVLIHGEQEDFKLEEHRYQLGMGEVWSSIIDMTENDGLGKVIERKKTILKDTLASGYITATRHGNGQDWWITIPKDCVAADCKQNRFFKILFTPQAVEYIHEQAIGGLMKTGYGQAHFTPNGSKYIISHSQKVGEQHKVDIYDFDRCTGLLSNYKQLKTDIADADPTDGHDFGSSLAISSNSRFAYLIMGNRIIQIDLWAEDMQASMQIVARYDGVWDPLPTNFLFGQLAPNGKIYICTGNGSKYLHVIHRPNEKGVACQVEQRGVVLPYQNSFSIPNFPNYRLYDLPDSPCDTLGIDDPNRIAVESDTTDQMTVLIDLYPNPANEVLTIEKINIEQAQFKLFSATAQLILEEQLTEDITTLDISSLPAGIYFCLVQASGQAMYSEKLIITN
ncbi:MAG: T9SS type A sorting domain-containing protein [Bacteroidota bacterium]